MELQNTWCYLCYYFVLFEYTLYIENKVLYEKALIKWVTHAFSTSARCHILFHLGQKDLKCPGRCIYNVLRVTKTLQCGVYTPLKNNKLSDNNGSTLLVNFHLRPCISFAANASYAHSCCVCVYCCKKKTGERHSYSRSEYRPPNFTPILRVKGTLRGVLFALDV